MIGLHRNWLMVVLTSIIGVGSAFAQEDPAKPATKPEAKAPGETPPPKATTDRPSDGPARDAFDKAIEEWKSILKDIRKLRVEYQSATEDDQPKLQEQWNALLAKGNETLPKLRDAALAAFEESNYADPQLERFLVKFVLDAEERDDAENGYALGKLLIEKGSPDTKLFDAAGCAAFYMNDFASAEKWLRIAGDSGALSAQGNELAPQIPILKALWEKEAEIRKAEAEKKDLPRVKLTTTKGDIVIELFENEAPDTVGNFVSLVESGFYDDKTFHRVLPHFMAQGGCPKGDGTGGPGYQIPCECYKENYRHHFRGALSMAHAGRDTGGSQFFITFKPTLNLDGKHTCFGRVVEGFDVLAKIQRRDPEAMPPLPTPDKIIKAEVLNKRDHAYAPKKVEQ